MKVILLSITLLVSPMVVSNTMASEQVVDNVAYEQLLKNGNFENKPARRPPEFWDVKNAELAKFHVEKRQDEKHGYAFYVGLQKRSLGKDKTLVLHQIIDMKGLHGKVLSFGGDVKTSNARVYVRLWTPVGHSYIEVNGAAAYRHFEKDFKVPEDALLLVFAVEVVGERGGEVWVDNLNVVKPVERLTDESGVKTDKGGVNTVTEDTSSNIISQKSPASPAITHLSIETPITTTADVGVVMTFPGDMAKWGLESIDRTYNTIKKAGVKISYLYYDWGELEKNKGNYDWGALGFNSQMVTKNNIKISLLIQVIHTGFVGKIPKDMKFTSFNNRKFKARFKDFILEVLKRFNGEIEYLWIGNEIDGYLNPNREQIEEYREFYSETYRAIKDSYPKMKVGTIITYYDAKNNKAKNNEISDIIQTVGAEGDIIGFSLYPQVLDGKPSDAERLFAEMTSIADKMGKKFAVTETAWSSKGYGGSEEKQVEYMRNLFNAYKKYEDKMEYLGLFNIYDFTEKDNKAILADFRITHKEFIKWTGSLGLAHNHGEAKQVWKIFLEEMKNF